MIRPLRQTLVLWLLSLRDLLVSAGPVLLLALGVLVAAYAWLDPQPPRQVTLATGPAGSAYAEFGTRYAQALARQGIRVARRTVAKYREQLSIAPARMRRRERAPAPAVRLG